MKVLLFGVLFSLSLSASAIIPKNYTVTDVNQKLYDSCIESQHSNGTCTCVVNYINTEIGLDKFMSTVYSADYTSTMKLGNKAFEECSKL
jgi:hypothetical protein